MKLRSSITTIAVLGALFVGVAGCSNIKPTEDHLKTLSETNIGEPVRSVSNVRSDSTQTYYLARTASGDYNCTVPSGATGGMLAFSSMGMMKPFATCQLKGTRGGPLTPFSN